MGDQLRRILYVEDEPDIQEVARLALEAVGGFDVAVCSSGREALERAPDWAPDLVLLDVMMPELDGPSTLQAMRARPDLASIPVIFMTAKVQTHEVQQYLRMGAMGVIQKPFDPMTLSEDVTRIWSERRS